MNQYILLSGPSREHATPTKHHRKHKHRATGSGNLSFPAVAKSFSSREAHPGSDRSTAHRGRSRKSNINKSWITGGLDEVESTVAIANMGRTVVEGPV